MKVGQVINSAIAAGINADKKIMNGSEYVLGRPGRALAGAGLALSGGYITAKLADGFLQELPKAVHSVASQVGPANTAAQIFVEAGRVGAWGAGTLMAGAMTAKTVYDFKDFATSIAKRETTSVSLSES